MRETLGISLLSNKGAIALVLVLALAGCEDLTNAQAESAPAAERAAGGTSVNRDVERPDVFSVSEKALWDGRPSLGGVWVAYPENLDPERVIIRNVENGKSVIGALFRRERENPGPKIQLSADAAVALGVIAGTPTEISIVVLRREEVVVDVPEAAVAASDANMSLPARRGALNIPLAPIAVAAPSEPADSFTSIVEQTLDETAAAANADTPAAEAAPAETVATNSGLATLFKLQKPYIQVATFLEEENANALVTQLAEAGIEAIVQADNPETPTRWRVVTGPYEKRADRNGDMRTIRGLGFTDAFTFK